jgi:hypothetical protein
MYGQRSGRHFHCGSFGKEGRVMIEAGNSRVQHEQVTLND